MMRLSKYLASCGLASRRKADELISEGKVKVNGRVVQAMGFRVDPDEDKISFDGKPVLPPETTITLALNKPTGVVTTVSDPYNTDTVMKFLGDFDERLFPVGRLDRDSEGLLLMTNDGELAHRLTHPKFHLEKEYEVIARGDVDRASLEALRNGVELDGTKTSKSNIRFLKSAKNGSLYSVILREGRKRQIRRMFEKVGGKVSQLKRIRIGPLLLGRLAPGSVRQIKGEELKTLRKAIDLD